MRNVSIAARTQSNTVRIRRWDGTSWQPLPTPDASASSLSLAATPDGSLLLAYGTLVQNGGNPHYTASLQKWKGERWRPVGAPGFASSSSLANVSLTTDSKGLPYVATSSGVYRFGRETP